MSSIFTGVRALMLWGRPGAIRTQKPGAGVVGVATEGEFGFAFEELQ
jgi:hypothetical protein